MFLWEIDTQAGTVVSPGRTGRDITSMTFSPAGELYILEGLQSGGSVMTLDIEIGGSTELFDPGLDKASMTGTPDFLYLTDRDRHLYRYDWETLRRDDLGMPGFTGATGGWDLATRRDGTVFYSDGQEIWRLGPEDRMIRIGLVAGLPLSSGGAVTFHGGEMWTLAAGVEAGTTELYIIDVEARLARPSGIIIPGVGIDALASRTP
jgi:hypothetical protein